MMYNVRRDRLYCCQKCQRKGVKMKIINTDKKICEKCGKEFQPKKFAHNRRYCYDCIPEVPEKGSEQRKIIKKWAVEEKGGKCSICGYNKCIEALEFHHLDPTQKDFILSDRNLILSWKEIKKELEKCILVCSNCHREIHAKKGEDE